MRKGFTLIELIVVIGIIALLAAIAVPVINGARKSAAITKAKTDLQTITTALEQYRIDHGDYPRAEWDTDNALNMPVLGWALFSPGPLTGIGADGANGPGFRIRAGGQGRVYGPYLKDGALDVRMDATTGAVDVLDTWGNPIQYYPKRPGKFNQSTGPVATRELIAPVVAGRLDALLNQHDGTANLPAMWIMLGDDNQNNVIDGSEIFRAEGVRFILISGGADGVVDAPTGATPAEQIQSMEKVDDVYNFSR